MKEDRAFGIDLDFINMPVGQHWPYGSGAALLLEGLP